MKHTFILILTILLISCHKEESKVVEIIAYNWSYSKQTRNDTLVVRLYAQISKNGNGILNIKNYDEKNRFIAIKRNDSKENYKMKRCNAYEINKEIINAVFELVENAKADTFVIKREEPFGYIYDGPCIRIAGINKIGKKINLQFNHTSRSNLNCVKLYDHLELICEKSFYNSAVDTAKILEAKEKLVKDIYKNEMHLLPKHMNSKIIFVPPIIKEDE